MEKKDKKNNMREIHPFTKEEEKQLEEKPLKDMKELLQTLDAWRRDSLASTLRF